MYVHRACKLSEMELDFEKKAGGFCAVCKIQGTVYHVIGEPDFYQHILNGVLYDVVEGAESTSMTAVWSAARLQTAKVKAARRGENWTHTIAEVAAEAELTEETEAIEEAVDEALEAVIEEAAEIEKEPEETPVEAEPEPITSTVGDLDELAEAQRLTEIEELEARLAELEKAKK